MPQPSAPRARRRRATPPTPRARGTLGSGTVPPNNTGRWTSDAVGTHHPLMAAYHDHSRRLQDRFDTRRLADRLQERTVRSEIDADDRAFIERMDMFFLATADEHGRPQCSYKGGEPGFVRVLDEPVLVDVARAVGEDLGRAHADDELRLGILGEQWIVVVH